MTFPKLNLSYFDIPGRAEAARLAFFLGNVPFEDDRFTFADFGDRKPTCPYGVVPVLQVDGETLGESRAIAQYAGRMAGLYPRSNPIAVLLIDEIMHAIDAFGEQFRPWHNALDPETKKNEELKLLEEIIPRHLSLIDERLKTIQSHVTFQNKTPDQIFLHELWLYQFVRAMLRSDWLGFVPNDITSSYPHWIACEAKVDAHPRVREWNAIHPTKPKTLKLIDVAVGGLGEPIRLALHIGGVAFEDERLTEDEFHARKASLPFHQVPVLVIDNDHAVSQSLAILRYVGTLTGLYPTTDDLLALKIDEILSVLDQMINSWSPATTQTTQAVTKTLAALNTRMASWRAPYATGARLTIADLAIYGVVHFLQSGGLAHVPRELVESFAELLAIHDLVREHPQVQASTTE